jgi:flagellar biosynthetic protein FliO
MSMGEQMMSVFGVLAILIATAFLLSKRGSVRFNFKGGGSRMKKLEVVERLPLTPQHSLHLVRLADRLLLLGVSPAGCSLIQNDVELPPSAHAEIGPK